MEGQNRRIACAAVIEPMKMLRDARMACVVKLRCSVDPCRQRQQWADFVENSKTSDRRNSGKKASSAKVG
jgi:hypothetical protein